MNKYNYLEEITNDIECWMDKDGDPFDISQFEDREKAKEFLYDELWTEEAITGNGPYGYADEFLCEEYLCHNIDLIIEACSEFDVDWMNINKCYPNNKMRYLDCTIRCYLLPEAINNALETWEDYGYKYGGEINGI